MQLQDGLRTQPSPLTSVSQHSILTEKATPDLSRLPWNFCRIILMLAQESRRPSSNKFTTAHMLRASTRRRDSECLPSPKIRRRTTEFQARALTCFPKLSSSSVNNPSQRRRLRVESQLRLPSLDLPSTVMSSRTRRSKKRMQLRTPRLDVTDLTQECPRAAQTKRTWGPTTTVSLTRIQLRFIMSHKELNNQDSRDNQITGRLSWFKRMNMLTTRDTVITLMKWMKKTTPQAAWTSNQLKMAICSKTSPAAVVHKSISKSVPIATLKLMLSTHLAGCNASPLQARSPSSLRASLTLLAADYQRR